MNGLDAVSTGALMLMGGITLVLLMQYVKLRHVWKMLLDGRAACRWVRSCEAENKELLSAMRAEKAHVEQLTRKLVLLQDLTSKSSRKPLTCR